MYSVSLLAAAMSFEPHSHYQIVNSNGEPTFQMFEGTYSWIITQSYRTKLCMGIFVRVYPLESECFERQACRAKRSVVMHITDNMNNVRWQVCQILLEFVAKFSSKTSFMSSAAGNSATATSIFMHLQRNVHERRMSTGPPARRLACPVNLKKSCHTFFQKLSLLSTRNSFQRRLFQGQHQRHRSGGRTFRHDQWKHLFLHSRDWVSGTIQFYQWMRKCMWFGVCFRSRRTSTGISWSEWRRRNRETFCRSSSPTATPSKFPVSMVPIAFM